MYHSTSREQEYEAPNMSALKSSFSSLTLEHTLEDLSARFIVNLPAEELESMDRICFQIEQAHWYYEDFVRPAAVNPSLLPSYSLKAFSLLMFRSCPLLHDLIPDHSRIWTSFMAYKERVPVCGAILINQYWDKVLLVKGWAKGASWSFPRGKINKHEAEGMCAIREVLEETGYDLSDSFPPEQLQPDWVEEEGSPRNPYYVELVIKEQKIRLYLIPNIHEDTYFQTRTRKEISKIDWFRVNDLPTWSKDKKPQVAQSGPKAKYYMVTPFISHLKLWIERNKPKNLPRRAEQHSSGGLSNGSAEQHRTGAAQDNHNLTTGSVPRPPSSPSLSSTEEDTDVEGDRKRPQRFDSTEEGTMALNAFFFGGDPSNVQSPQTVNEPLPSQESPAIPRPDPPSYPSTSHNSTPPHIAYERQQSFLHPRPKPTTQHTMSLLALLTNQNPATTPPPPAPNASKTSGRADPGQPNAKNTDLLAILRGDAQSSHRPTQQYQPGAVQSHSMLSNDSEAPREVDRSGITRLPLDDQREDADREEKRNALMQALFSVGAR